MTRLVLLLVAALIIAGIGFFIKNGGFKKDTPTAPQQNNGTETINYSPPTAEDAMRVDANKEKIANQNSGAADNGGAKKVTPVITYAGQYNNTVEVGGYINGVFEDGGSCTATFSNGSKSFNKTVVGIRGSNNTNCPALTASTEEFSPKGTWEVTLTYSSSAANGVSVMKQVEVK